MTSQPLVLPPALRQNYFSYPWHAEIARFPARRPEFEEVADAFISRPYYLSARRAQGAVYDGDGLIVDAARHDREDKELTGLNPLRIDLPRNDSVDFLPGTYIYLGWYFSHYGHFLLESLSRAWACGHFREEDGYSYIFHDPEKTGRMNPDHYDIFRWLGVSPESLILKSEDVRVERLIVPRQLVVIGRTLHPSALEVYRKMASACQADRPKASYPTRLYVSRRHLGPAQRKALNEREIERYFSSNGFYTIHPERVPLKDQIRFFANAEQIAGFEGSGLHNVLFSERKPAVLMLSPLNRVPGCINQMVLNDATGCKSAILLFESIDIERFGSANLSYIAPREAVVRWARTVFSMKEDTSQATQVDGDFYRLQLMINGALLSVKAFPEADMALLSLIASDFGFSEGEKCLFLAVNEFYRDNRDRALAYVNKSLQNQAPNNPALFMRAVILHSKKDFESATADCRRLIREERESSLPSDVFFLLARILKDQGQFEKAISVATEAIRREPDKTEYHLILSELFRATGDLRSAKAAVLDALSLDESLSSGHGQLALILAQEGRLEEAFLEAQKAALSGGADKGLYQRLGVLLLTRGDNEGAEKMLRRAVETDASNAAAYHHLSVALGNQGRLDEAIAKQRYAVAENPDNPLYALRLGMLMLRRGDDAGAEEALLRAIQLDENSAAAYHHLSIAMARQDRLAEATEMQQKAVENAPDNPRYVLRLGALRLLGGADRDAEGAFLRAVELDNNNAAAYHQLSIATANQGRLAEAIEMQRSAVAREPENAQYLLRLGVLLLRRQSDKEAEQTLRRAVSLDPDMSAAYHHLSTALNNQGRLEEAIEAETTAVRLNGSVPSYRTALESLRRQRADPH